MEGIKGGEEGVLTSLDKLAARYSRWQRDRSFTRFQRRPRCSSIFFPIVHQKIFTRHARWVAVERFGCQENGASFSWREIRNSKSDVRSWSNDICASGEDHVANRVNDLNLKFNSVSTNLTCVSSVFALNFVKQSTKFVEEWESSCKWIREDRANFRRCRWYPWLVWKINVDNVRECVNWSVIVRFAWSTTERQRSGWSDDRRLITGRTQIFQHPIACQPPSFSQHELVSRTVSCAHESLNFLFKASR